MFAKKILGGLCLLLSIHVYGHEHLDTPPWQEATGWPDRVVATIESDPSKSFSVTWRTHRGVAQAIAQLTPALPEARFDLNAITYKARTESVDPTFIEGPKGPIPILENQGLPPVHYHSVTFKGLKPDTLYAYRVRGDLGKWTAWRQLRTAPKNGPLCFVFFGDAQTGIRSHITRAFDAASQVAPDARFIIHGGDLVNSALYDREWAEWFEAVGRTYMMLPSMPVPGNHEYVNFTKMMEHEKSKPADDKLFIAEKSVSSLWRPQFTLPVVEELPEDLHETVYDIRYSEELHIFALDSSGIAFDEQLEWLDKKLSETTAKWRVLTMHHPIFSFVGGIEHPSAKERREKLLKVLKDNDVDLVLTGHRHSYQRAESGDNVARYTVGEAHNVDTVFVVTASSTKRGETKVEGWKRYAKDQNGNFNLARYADYVPIFAVFRIDDDELRYEAHDTVGSIYDAFVVRKSDDGAKVIENGTEASGPILNKENLGAYRSWHDLR